MNQNGKIQDQHIDQPNVVQQQNHAAKLGNAIKRKGCSNREAQNQNAFENTDKNEIRGKQRWIPHKLQRRQQYKIKPPFVFIGIVSALMIKKIKLY